MYLSTVNNKMKNQIVRVLSAVLLGAAFVGLTACQTVDLKTAAELELGNGVATYVLDNTTNQAGAVQALSDLAAILPGIALGQVSSAQLGVVNRELIAMQTLSASNQKVLDQIGSLIGLISNMQAAGGGGAVTPVQALLAASGNNVALGIENAIAYKGLDATADVPKLTKSLAVHSIPTLDKVHR